MAKRISRRGFLKGAALGGAGLLVLKDSRLAFGYPANEKLNVAGIGVGGKGRSGVAGCRGENIVALCDVDWRHAAATFSDWPEAKRYWDFRKMLDEMENQIDAVVVSTPDHTHGVAAAACMRMGKHVYCEKPLTRTIYEARLLRDLARKHKLATQMGNQGTASNGLRECVEVIQSGVLGQVKEVHVWSNRPIWPQGVDRPKDTPPVPSHLAWDLWLGPAPVRPYHPAYLPFNWRGWFDFGAGALGDMGCHTLNMPFMALDLRTPISIEAECFGSKPETYPKQSVITHRYAGSHKFQPRKLKWYDGGLRPSPDLAFRTDLPSSGALIIGDNGRLLSHGDNGDNYELLPKEKFENFQKPEPTLPRSPGHHEEWLRACKGGEAAMSNFEYAVPLTEFVLLGNLAILTGEKIFWDAENMRAINCPKAAEHVTPSLRKGWTL